MTFHEGCADAQASLQSDCSVAAVSFASNCLVDNRLKDVMDALQGHVGGHGKKQRGLAAIIPNDNQVYRVTIEKSLTPEAERGLARAFDDNTGSRRRSSSPA